MSTTMKCGPQEVPTRPKLFDPPGTSHEACGLVQGGVSLHRVEPIQHLQNAGDAQLLRSGARPPKTLKSLKKTARRGG